MAVICPGGERDTGPVPETRRSQAESSGGSPNGLITQGAVEVCLVGNLSDHGMEWDLAKGTGAEQFAPGERSWRLLIGVIPAIKCLMAKGHSGAEQRGDTGAWFAPELAGCGPLTSMGYDKPLLLPSDSVRNNSRPHAPCDPYEVGGGLPSKNTNRAAASKAVESPYKCRLSAPNRRAVGELAARITTATSPRLEPLGGGWANRNIPRNPEETNEGREMAPLCGPAA
ncbi:unnamed protein product [Pleuronectes platessa]|uniref:Uncharacterized protein n=1 Tax=Pleuronectes platessa TaxID=8262 RepID=A0A9N7VSF8_PLEPL|nr:unnamed protein product [Pleuronectes platessa]